MPSDFYFERFGFCPRQVAEPPPPDLGIIVVIPCFNEPDLVGSLESLRACDRPVSSVEVIVVINSPADCAETVRLQNQETHKAAAAWIANHDDHRLAFHVLHFPELPPKQAGVGLARKIGMDEALRRFHDLGKAREGVIACYDADCRCDRNYLTSVARHFKENSRSSGCSIYFEHPLSGPLDGRIYEAIAAYELHLRFYVQALRFAGFPHAFHTVGSAMAVRADVYERQGGMNKRKAGEDFYFLQKIIPLGGFTNLTTTRVIPSPRASDRVPFGTGRAVADYLNQGRTTTYPWQAFLDLKAFFARLPLLYREEGSPQASSGDELPDTMRTFLEARGFAAALAEIRQHTATAAAFQKRLFRWFDGFQVMKFMHHARDRFYPGQSVEVEAGKLLEALAAERRGGDACSITELLRVYRELDRRAGCEIDSSVRGSASP